jgi:DNA (cytosine-5)-methyltransferase 1
VNELALFAGAGGGILGGLLLGWRTVCAVERDAYAAGVLAQRQNDGALAPFPIWSDITTFDGRPWRGIVDVVSGGFPCQDISAAGKGAGIDGERSGLWREMARIIREVGPRFVWVENSPMLTSRGLDVVLGDLAALGFDARWGVLSAADVGAPHERERIWIFAYANGAEIREQSIVERRRESSALIESDGEVGLVADTDSYAREQRWENNAAQEQGGRKFDRGDIGARELANTPRIQQGRPQQRAERERTGARSESGNGRNAAGARLQEREIFTGREITSGEPSAREIIVGTSWWKSEPDVGRVADGVAFRVDRLKALGNGQVPEVDRRAFNILSNCHTPDAR